MSYANDALGYRDSAHFQENTVYQPAVQEQVMRWIAAIQNPHAMQIYNESFSQQQQAFGVPNTMAGPSTPITQPTSFSPADDHVLACAIYDSQANGRNYKQAIEELHGVNGISAYQWKDYFLDHRPRIDLLITRISDLSALSLNKHFPSQISDQRHPLRAIQGSAPPTRPSRRRGPSSEISKRSEITKPRVPSGRSTINSLATFSVPPTTALSARVTIPEPPLREPSPPTEVVAFRKLGNAFTPADTQFMIKYISWEMSRNPGLNKSNLCDMLEAKAPHHPACSWRQHMRASDRIIDRIIAEAGDGDGNSSCAADDRESKFNQALVGPSESEYGTIAAKEDEDSADDEKNMGLKGTYTAADRRLLAKYIASVEDWKNQDDPERFVKFYERFPHKALRSWSRFYVRNSKELDALVRKYKRAADSSRKILPTQVAPLLTPSDSSSTLPPALKRKHRNSDGNRYIYMAKRWRGSNEWTMKDIETPSE